MTRLKTEWVAYMIDGMEDYNNTLREKTGVDLAGLMMRTFNIGEEEFRKAIDSNKVAVVPITQGEGIIGSFAESVAAIINSIGFEAVVSEHTDVNGIYEGFRNGCNIFFLADDSRYLALNIEKNKASDNNYATALGFIEVLEAMMEKRGKDIHKEKILQIGNGIVGKEAVKLLKDRNIDFDIYDKNFAAIESLDCKKITSADEIRNYDYILDFTNEGPWLGKDDLSENVVFSTPGVPYSMDEEAAEHFEAQSVHDNLEIGTAIMLAQVIA